MKPPTTPALPTRHTGDTRLKKEEESRERKKKEHSYECKKKEAQASSRTPSAELSTLPPPCESHKIILSLQHDKKSFHYGFGVVNSLYILYRLSFRLLPDVLSGVVFYFYKLNFLSAYPLRSTYTLQAGMPYPLRK